MFVGGRWVLVPAGACLLLRAQAANAHCIRRDRERGVHAPRRGACCGIRQDIRLEHPPKELSGAAAAEDSSSLLVLCVVVCFAGGVCHAVI